MLRELGRHRTLPVAADSAGNRADLAAFLAERLGTEELAKRLAGAKVTAEEAAPRLAALAP